MKISVTYIYVLLAIAHLQWQRREQDAFFSHILTADEVSTCKMALSNAAAEESCMKGSKCSESDECHVFLL